MPAMIICLRTREQVRLLQQLRRHHLLLLLLRHHTRRLLGISHPTGKLLLRRTALLQPHRRTVRKCHHHTVPQCHLYTVPQCHRHTVHQFHRHTALQHPHHTVPQRHRRMAKRHLLVRLIHLGRHPHQILSVRLLLLINNIKTMEGSLLTAEVRLSTVLTPSANASA